MEILKALVPFAIPVAVIVICMTLMIAILAVVFLDLDIETGSDKFFTLKMKKRSPAVETGKTVPHMGPAVEPPLLPQHDLSFPTHEPVPQDLEPEEKEKEDAQTQSRDTFWQYISASSLTQLDASYELFMSGVGAENVEFWRTDYLSRREKFGADRGREAMRELAAEQPTWAYPHAVMLNWAFDDHDFSGAQQHLDVGLTKMQSQHFGHVLSAGVKLMFRMQGKHMALRFACEWSKADLTDSIRAGIFVTLAEILKEAGDADGYRVALEFASSLQPSNDSRTFNLAYSYAETRTRWAPAIYNYQKLVSASDDGPVSRNNVGIIYADIDKALAVQTYEIASRDGDKYASANLAHLLIEDGYISIAQSLLDSVENPGNAAENHASAKTAALAAKRRVEEKLKEITEAVKTDVLPYKASLAAAFRSLQSGRTEIVRGYFASSDRNVIALIDGDKALCQLRIANVVFDGQLQNQATCFAGFMSTKGGTLLTSETAQFSLINEGDGVIRLFRWPARAGLQHRVEAYELQQVEEVPELAAPPPQQPLFGGLLANALAVNKILPNE